MGKLFPIFILFSVFFQAFISWLGTLTNAALVYLFHPEKHAVLSSRFGTSLRATVPGSIGGSEPLFGVEGTLAAPLETHAPSHLEIHAPAAHGDPSSTITSTWHILLMPALLVTLASSHGYILLRAAIRHIVWRAVWRGSKEEREIKRMGETIKEACLGQMRRNERKGKDSAGTGGSSFALPTGVSIGVDVGEVGSDQMNDTERLFWERDLDEAGVWSAISGKED